MPCASRAIRCDHFATLARSVPSLAVAAAGTESVTALKKLSASKAPRCTAHELLREELVVAALVPALLVALVVVAALVVRLLACSLLDHLGRGVLDLGRRVLLLVIALLTLLSRTC